MKYERLLKNFTPKGLVKRFSTDQIYLGIWGIFDTTKALWTYYRVSYVSVSGKIYLTPDICTSTDSLTGGSIENLIKYGIKINSVEEGEEWCETFKTKWESGSNDAISEQRDKKLEEILK
jgi:hypothetical protein